MEIYTIGGLGADERIFKNLNIGVKTTHLKWHDPIKGESLTEYCHRFLPHIQTDKPFGILGVSFGGIVAIELSKIVKPRFIILVSTVTNYSELPSLYVILGKIFLPVLPISFAKPPQVVMNYMFGAKNRKLLAEILSDTEPEFIKWALTSILSWKGSIGNIPFLRIHGDRDRVIPLKGEAVKIEKGGHFMIVDNSNQITELVKNYLT